MAARLPVNGFPLRVLPIAACSVLLLSGCQSNANGTKIVQLVYEEVTSIGGSGDISREKVVAVPFATLGVRVGSSDQAMFVLGTKAGNDLRWVGGTQFALTTRDGRILRTAGFMHNLTGFQESEGSTAAAATARSYRYDLADANAYGIVVNCNERDAGAERIVILGDEHETRHVIEDCTAPQLDWNFSNEFWKDATNGYVWKSVQYVHPGLDPVELETLRPAG